MSRRFVRLNCFLVFFSETFLNFLFNIFTFCIEIFSKFHILITKFDKIIQQEVCTAPMPVAAPPMPISEVAGVMKDVAPHENIPAEYLIIFSIIAKNEFQFN